MTEFLSSDYWSKRYSDESTGWDLGQISPPVKAYVDSLQDHSLTILIPGCGYGHEGLYLFNKGFKDVHLLDFSMEPMKHIQQLQPDFPASHLHVEDFFEHVGSYDLIIEQTLFCAIDPSQRAHYVEKIHSLLKVGGKLVGVLFDRPFDGGPPFGGSRTEYIELFSSFFQKIKMETCMNSVEPRMGTEVFIEIVK